VIAAGWDREFGLIRGPAADLVDRLYWQLQGGLSPEPVEMSG
jgi:hypothetical protein